MAIVHLKSNPWCGMLKSATVTARVTSASTFGKDEKTTSGYSSVLRTQDMAVRLRIHHAKLTGSDLARGQQLLILAG